jgi:membrane protein YqaA with SNARE-associated domain
MQLADAGMAGLFVSAFVSATFLPGNSEIVLAAMVSAFPERAALAVAIASLGNTLGGLTTYGLGRLAAHQVRASGRALEWVRRYGALALLLSWLPFVGDALCAAAGVLRVPWRTATLAMALGKFARYAAIAAGMAAL